MHGPERKDCVVSKFFYLFFIAGSFVPLLTVGRNWKLKPESRYAHTPYIGETAVLTIEGGNTVWLAVDRDDCSSMNTAMAGHDVTQLRGCEDTQTAFRVPAGTFVKVTAESGSRNRVVIQKGPLAGKAGWIEFQYLRPRRPGEFR